MIGWTESDKEEREWEVGAKFTHNYCNFLENMTKETKPQFLVCEKYGTVSCHANGTAQPKCHGTVLPWHGENATARTLPWLLENEHSFVTGERKKMGSWFYRYVSEEVAFSCFRYIRAFRRKARVLVPQLRDEGFESPLVFNRDI